MALPTLFTDPFFTQVVLPFLLIFVIVYAILQKSKILTGESENRPINIIVAFIIAFLFVGVPSVVGVTLNIIPIIAIILVILLSFMLIFGFAGIDVHQNRGIKIAIGIILGIALLATVIWATGMKLPKLSEEAINYIIIFALIIGAGAAILSSETKKK